LKIGANPQFKVEVSGETYTNNVAFNIINKRVENNISYLALTVDDYKSQRFVDVFDAFDTVDLSLRYDSDSWTKVFSGVITSAKPHLSRERGEILAVGAWGLGKALVDTHCDEAYGVESLGNPLLDTPTKIIEDLIANHINKEFGGAASGYSIADKVETINYPDGGNTFSITHLNSQYLNNYVNINNVCSLANAYAQRLGTPEVSIHWFVDPSGNLYLKKIDDDHSDGNWDRYYGGSQANATIEVNKDMILYDFSKNVEEYANSVILSSLFRKPSEDYWTEDAATNALWGEAGGGDGFTDDAVNQVVGSDCLRHDTDGAVTQMFYPAAQNAGWNLNNFSSPNTCGSVNFYMWIGPNMADVDIYFFTQAAHSWDLSIFSKFTETEKWFHFSIPVGDYANRHTFEPDAHWVKGGALADWSNINWFQIDWDGDAADYILLNDLHFSGMIVREARDVAEIAAHDLHQKVIRNDTATNDTLIAADDSGTAAQLCYAELLRRSQTPTVATIQIPMLPDLLPGQTLHIHACEQSDGTFRIDQDFRVKDLRHEIVSGAGFRTVVNLTSDVTNTHAFGVPSQYSLLKQFAGALKHSEARNLKGGTMDNLIPRLSVNY